ncbi:MAG: hypothetical protein AAF849_23320 [Bacteroidota bacterium]
MLSQCYLFGMVMLLMSFFSCNTSKSVQVISLIKDSEFCTLEKAHLQSLFEEEDYGSMIQDFPAFKDCYIQERTYYYNLGGLYYLNQQDSLAYLAHQAVAQFIDADTSLSANERLLQKGYLEIMHNDKYAIEKYLSEIDTTQLMPSEQGKMEFLNLFMTQGKYETNMLKATLDLFGTIEIKK